MEVYQLQFFVIQLYCCQRLFSKCALQKVICNRRPGRSDHLLNSWSPGCVNWTCGHLTGALAFAEHILSILLDLLCYLWGPDTQGLHLGSSSWSHSWEQQEEWGDKRARMGSFVLRLTVDWLYSLTCGPGSPIHTAFWASGLGVFTPGFGLASTKVPLSILFKQSNLGLSFICYCCAGLLRTQARIPIIHAKKDITRSTGRDTYI